MKSNVVATVGITAVLAFLGPRPASAQSKQSSGPSTSKPDALLWVNFEKRLGDLRAEAEKLMQRVTETLAEEPEKAGAKTYENIFLDIRRLRRINAELSVFGEPLSEDLRMRTEALYTDFRQRLRVAAEAPELKRDIIRSVTTLDRAINVANRKLGEPSELASKKKYVAALDSFYKIANRAEMQGIWWDIQKGRRHASLVNWDKSERGYLIAASEEWAKQGKEMRAMALAKLNVDLQGFLQQVTVAAAAVGQSGKHQLSTGESVSGPLTVKHFGDLWVKLHLRMMQARALTMISFYVGDGTRVDQFDKSYNEFVGQMVPALASIIAADAQRASADETVELYFQYVENLAPVMTRSAGPTLAAFEPPLKDLAARSPELSSDLDAYHAATDEILRWRKRMVEAYLRSWRQTELPVDQYIDQACKPYNTRKVLLTKNREHQTLARLKSPMPELIQELASAFNGKPCSVNEPRFSAQRGSFAISRFENRSLSYVLFSPDQVSGQIQALAQELLVPGDATAPALEAQYALYSGRQGNALAAGGTIRRIGLIGFPTRFINMAEDDRGLVRPGPFVKESENIRKEDLIMMFMLEPKWIAHPYFVARLSN